MFKELNKTANSYHCKYFFASFNLKLAIINSH